MATVEIDESGQIELPVALLEQSHLKPGAPLLVITGEGGITLIDPERLRQRASRADAGDPGAVAPRAGQRS